MATICYNLFLEFKINLLSLMKIVNVLYFRDMKITKNRSGCPLSTSLDIIGDKWSLVVVRDLFLGRDTFSKIMTENPEKIASNILSDRLKKMKAKGILDFRICPIDKKVKTYYLTDLGIDLYPTMYELMYWTLKHFELHPIAKSWLTENKDNTDTEIIANAMQSYKSHRKEVHGF